MEFNFLGRGAAFNTSEGNTSAFFIDDNRDLYLVDCGESTFAKMQELDMFKDINDIHVMLTHTHSDHVGSLGSLVMYSYYILRRPLNIILPSHPIQDGYLLNIEDILNGFGCTQDMYVFRDQREYDNKSNMFNSIRFAETKHVPEMKSYGIVFNTNDGVVYYSGDTKDTSNIEKLIASGKTIDKIYVDMTNLDYPANVHMFVGKLNSIIPPCLKEKVYGMHVNNPATIEMAEYYGFNVVSNVDDSYPRLKK